MPRILSYRCVPIYNFKIFKNLTLDFFILDLKSKHKTKIYLNLKIRLNLDLKANPQIIP